MQQESIKAKGVYKFTRAQLETPEHFEINKKIEWHKMFGTPYAAYKHLVDKLNSICKTDVFIYENLVPTVARTMIANNLTNASPTNVMKITHGALGSSGTAPANADTQLGTEVYRNAISSITNAANVAYATAFYAATETTGTYAEAGIFSNGTGTANSGVLVSHVSTSITKTNTQTLTLDWSVTFS